jgi:hypothetical protein
LNFIDFLEEAYSGRKQTFGICFFLLHKKLKGVFLDSFFEKMGADKEDKKMNSNIFMILTYGASVIMFLMMMISVL